MRKQGAATQLIVDGSPFLILGGELHNSTSSNLDYMVPVSDEIVGVGNYTQVGIARHYSFSTPEYPDGIFIQTAPD